MFKQVLKRVIIGIVVTVLLFCVVTSSYSRKTSASIFPALALGTGALSALVASYFATAGIEFSGNDLDANFLGNYIANWVKGSSAWSGNPYFSSSGEYIGDPDQLSIVQNNETSATSIIFGKEFAIWMEALKELFVNDNNLSSSNIVILDSVTFDTFPSGERYPVFPQNSIFTGVQDSLLGGFGILGGGYGSFTLKYNDSIYIDITKSFGSDTYDRYDFTSYYNGSIRTDFFALRSNQRLIGFGSNSGYINCFLIQNILDYSIASRPSIYWGSLASLNNISSSTISLEGSLTDGYDDFADAVSTPLESDDEDLVIATGVGVIPDILNPADIIDAILDKIAIGELNPTYEGSYENKESAEEELEGEREFVPVLPDGWVKVEGLQSFFPFCIPWDIYSVIALLNVPPEAPNFTWKMDFGGRFDSYDIEIDLSDFEIVARVFRIMIVIGFLLFLILKTRDLIRG